MPRQSPEARLKNPTCKRGAQYGNTNAMIHGFYSRHFKQGEIADLDAIMAEGVQDEISMLRVLTRRAMEMANEMQTPEATAYILGALGLAAIRTASLLRTQKLLGASNNASAVISQALAEVVKELGLHA